MASRFLALLGLFGLVGAVFSLDDRVFSGPQPGESWLRSRFAWYWAPNLAKKSTPSRRRTESRSFWCLFTRSIAPLWE